MVLLTTSLVKVGTLNETSTCAMFFWCTWRVSWSFWTWILEYMYLLLLRYVCLATVYMRSMYYGRHQETGTGSHEIGTWSGRQGYDQRRQRPGSEETGACSGRHGYDLGRQGHDQAGRDMVWVDRDRVRGDRNMFRQIGMWSENTGTRSEETRKCSGRQGYDQVRKW